MSDIFDKCHRFVRAPAMIGHRDLQLAARIFARTSPPKNAGPWIEEDGQRLLQFSSNDYLGLASHPEVHARVREVAERYGIASPMGSRLMTGNTRFHIQLEEEVARFKRTEAAMIFPAGAMAMIGTLACLAGPDDLLLLDEQAHATLVCGAKASGAKVRFFRHNDLGHLESVLERSDGSQAKAIVVDGVYSMAGDLGPLADLVDMKHRYNARLIVDDAHGTGVFGPQGRGTAAHFDVEEHVDLHLGTFSKAVGTIGGFAAGQEPVIQYIRFHAPTYVFTKSVPLPVVAATLASLKLLEQADDRRRKLWENARRLQEGLRAVHLDLGHTQSPITPIRLPGSEALYVAEQLLRVHGIWAAPVVYPAVGLGQSVLRLIPTAMHSPSDIDFVVQSIATIRAAMALGTLPIE
ncbi:MAG TPA: aminotransferase class I/II-fold pyridoxal phosphate-dependent enzyme [Planctomycetaceae bacterium]|nr:aminotransferase class I/II-fold pyridoxal phosphate-dependent enzyme [Planctomycetaceae bacterium]HIQ22853.1 aminotransferase class I/II-fold pyridoxal phosphate-dependent enzyme [Planctomycetota bacterium]